MCDFFHETLALRLVALLLPRCALLEREQPLLVGEREFERRALSLELGRSLMGIPSWGLGVWQRGRVQFLDGSHALVRVAFHTRPSVAPLGRKRSGALSKPVQIDITLRERRALLSLALGVHSLPRAQQETQSGEREREREREKEKSLRRFNSRVSSRDRGRTSFGLRESWGLSFGVEFPSSEWEERVVENPTDIYRT